MTKPINIALLVFDGIQILDVMGPAAVFGAANDAIQHPFYRVHVLSPDGGMINSNSGIAIDSRPLKNLAPRSIDTMLISGGGLAKVAAFAANDTVRKWVLKASVFARRYGSICTGAFALGEFGLITGKRIATHWSTCSELKNSYPEAQVETNALFVEDGK
jgi:transcriptional regulator GlxA family with amidase domain